MPVQVKVDFYTVKVPKGSTFEGIIEDDAKTKNDDSRNADIRGFPVRLQKLHVGKEYLEGDMLRIQMSDLPPKAKLSGKIGDLDLADDEGIGGETAFLYDPLLKVIALQRNRRGVGARALAEYFEDKAELDDEIELQPIIQGAAIARLARMKETRRLKVRFAGVTNAAYFKRQGVGVEEMIDVLEFFRAPSGTFEMSMGRESGSLWTKRIITLGRRLITMSPDVGGGDVTTMEVSGILDDDSKDEFDVLSYRMVEVVTVNENKHRRSSYKRRRPEIRTAWDRRKKELKDMYGATQ